MRKSNNYRSTSTSTIFATLYFFTFQVHRAEAIMALMLVEHDLSFNTADHLSKAVSHAFRDSDTAKSYSSGRTKTTALITHDLGVHARDKVGINRFCCSSKVDGSAIKSMIEHKLW